MKVKKQPSFWASYSDLMSNLFFIMLVLFVLVLALLSSRVVQISTIAISTANQLKILEEIEKSTDNIDSVYFEYKPEFKKHVVKIKVNFETGCSDISNIGYTTQQKLAAAGKTIQTFIKQNTEEYKEYDIQYLLIIEGQASKDNWDRNYELSYERALSLKKFWDDQNIHFGDKCEVLISGSGDGRSSGTDFMREHIETDNQRFLIHIIPKPGIVEKVSN